MTEYARDKDGKVIDAKPRKLRAVQPPPERDERPAIRVPGELDALAHRATKALERAAGLYHRDGQLVRIVRRGRSDQTTERPDGTPEIRPHTRATLRRLMSSEIRWYKRVKDDGGGEERSVTVDPPSAVAAAVLEEGDWPNLRRLDGVVETPVIRPDGTVLDTPGWDPSSGLLYAPSEVFDPIPDRPSRDDARRAIQALREPFAQFPYAPKEGWIVPVAAMLTMVCRAAIRGSVPGFSFTAVRPRSGKSLQVQALTRLATGRWSLPRTFPSREMRAGERRVDNEALDKALGAIALSGDPFVDFDNVDCPVEGAPLARVLTVVDEQAFRVLGESRDAKIAWRQVVLLGGNNLTYSREMGPRFIEARLEPETESADERASLSPEEGGYTHPRLRAWVVEHRPRLLRELLVLARAWFAAGRPSSRIRVMAGFEEWSDVVPQLIRWAGGPDVTAFVPTEGSEDGAERALGRELTTLWASYLSAVGLTALTAKEVVGALYPNGKRPRFGKHGERDHDGEFLPAPDGWEPLRDALEMLSPPKRPGDAPSAISIGSNLGRRAGQVANCSDGKRRRFRNIASDGYTAKWSIETIA